jgi:predicted RND superfamily exporter protein
LSARATFRADDDTTTEFVTPTDSDVRPRASAERTHLPAVPRGSPMAMSGRDPDGDDDRTALAGLVVRHSRLVLAVGLVLTLVVGGGVVDLERETSLETFQSDSVESAKLEYLSREYGLAAPDQSVGFVFYRDENVLSKASQLRVLRYQRALVENETVSQALVDGRATASTPTLVATAAIRAEREGGDGAYFDRPTLDEQIAQLESMSPAAVERVTERVLAEDAPRRSLFYQPTDYEAGTAESNATMVLAFATGETGQVSGAANDELVASQTAMRAIAEERFGEDSLAFGSGLVKAELSRSVTDSLQLLVPFVLLFVVGVLALAYRDLVDLTLSLLGLGTVLLWTLGFMGWLDITFIQLYVPVVIFLVGLGIDFGIHVVMRHREARAETSESRPAMRRALGGVGLALVMVTVTTAVGFLSNGSSDVGAIRNFGLIAAWGVLAALLVFGAFVPALKLELESLVGRSAGDGRAAFGTGGRLARLLSGGASLAYRAPVAVVLLAVVVAGAGGAAGTTVDTTFEQTAFMAQDPPDWTEDLPGPMATGEYEVRDTLAFTNRRFIRHDLQTQLLVEGDVTADDTLDRLDGARRRVNARESTYYLANGEPATSSPLSVLEQTARANESFAATVRTLDTDDDGVPDRDVERVYDELYELRPALASNVINRNEAGEYTDVRLTISLVGETSSARATAEARATARRLDGDGLRVTATGRPVLFEEIQQDLAATIVEAMAITFGLVVGLLALIYRWRYGSATLGLVTAVPVTLALGWLVGTMWLLDLSFNALTALITSISVGLGVDYAIHLTDRYVDELGARGDVRAALGTAVRGTGGALLGSAVTTAGGFGVLVFAIVPPIAAFGALSALSIGYAFLATVLVLPSLLVLWTRYAAPAGLPDGTTTGPAAAATDD